MLLGSTGSPTSRLKHILTHKLISRERHPSASGSAEYLLKEERVQMVADISISDQVATVTLNTPSSMNALLPEAFGALRDIFTSLRDNEDIGAVILTGKGRAFCAGAALDGFLDGDQLKMTPESLRRLFDEHVNPLMRTIIEFPKPIVVAINGTVAGAGMGLALAGDIVIASEDAKFYCGFVKMLGLVPDAGTSWLLPALMGRNKALPFALLGDGLTAQQASDAAMIFHTIPASDLMEKAMDYAARLAATPARALCLTRKIFTDAPNAGYSATLDCEREANVELIASVELKEGVMAFLEKRAPDFAGVVRKDRSDQ